MASLCNGINCQHADGIIKTVLNAGRELVKTTDPESVLNAARGGGSSTSEQIGNANNISKKADEISSTLLQRAQETMENYLVYKTPEDELLHGHISDAQLAFYARNLLVLLAFLITVFVVVKLCVSHRCWQRRYQKYKKPVPLDYSVQVRQLREKEGDR